MSDQEPSDAPNPYDAGRSDAWNQPGPATPPTATPPTATPPPAAFYGSVLPSGGQDLLSNGTFEPTPPARRRNVTAIVLSLVAVLAVIAGGVTYVGYHKLASKGAQPDGWAPANSIAYVKLDLDPSAAEKISALQFEQKFPSAPRVTDAAKLKDALLDAIFKSDTNNPINYATDVKPWLGSRVALAVYLDGLGKPQPVGILQITDATKAKAGLAKLAKDQAASDSLGATSQKSPAPGLTFASDMPSVIPDDTLTSTAQVNGYVIEGDYAVVASSQQAADAAVAAAKKSNIGANSTYAADVATLKGDRVVTAWTDLGALLKLADSSGALGGAGMLVPGGLGSLGGLAGNAVKGRAVAGVSIHSDYAELEGRILGSDVSAYSNPQAGALIKALPSGAVVGLSVSGFAASAKKQLDTLLQSPLLGGGASQLDAIGSRLGIAFPDDVLNLLGNNFAASLDSVPSGGASAAKFTAITQPTDAAKGLDTAKKLAAAAGAAGFPLTASADGTKVVLTNEHSAPTGSLGADAGFKSAMSGMPDQVVAAAYVNLSDIWDAAPLNAPADLKHLAGLGMYAGIDGSDFVFAVRLTIK